MKWEEKDQILRGLGGEETGTVLTLKLTAFLFSVKMYGIMTEVQKIYENSGTVKKC